MTKDQWISLFGALISLAGFLVVVLQMQEGLKQRRLEVLYQIYDVNRQLLMMAYSDPEIFKILNDKDGVDPDKEKHYLQMWLNQLSMIHSHLQSGGFDEEFSESLRTEIIDWMSCRNMQRHWDRFAYVYPPSFQKLANDILEEVGPPKVAAVTS